MGKATEAAARAVVDRMAAVYEQSGLSREHRAFAAVVETVLAEATDPIVDRLLQGGTDFGTAAKVVETAARALVERLAGDREAEAVRREEEERERFDRDNAADPYDGGRLG